MKQHDWINEVLQDLVSYADQNDLPSDVILALNEAASIAKGALPKVYTDFVPRNVNALNI